MSKSSEKHMEAAREVLVETIHEHAGRPLGASERAARVIATALVNAEREGMMRAAEIAKRYGSFDVNTDYGAGYKQAVLNVRAAILSEAGEG